MAPIAALSSDWDDVATYTDAAQNFRLGALWLSGGHRGARSRERPRASAREELIEDSKAYAECYIEARRQGDRRARGSTACARGSTRSARCAGTSSGRRARRRRDAIRRAAAEAERVAAEYRRLEPKLLDAARAAFRADDDSLKSLADFLDKHGTNLDIGLGIFEMSRDISGALMKAKGLDVPPIGKFADALGKLNKGLSALNLALSLRGEAGKTELDKGINGIGFAAGAFSALGTLLGASAHIGLYANLYLVPLTKACLEGVAKLGEHMHEQNKTWVEAFGAPGNYAGRAGRRADVAVHDVGDEGHELEDGRRALRRRRGVLLRAPRQVQHRRERQVVASRSCRSPASTGSGRSTRRSSRAGSSTTATRSGRCSTAR